MSSQEDMVGLCAFCGRDCELLPYQRVRERESGHRKESERRLSWGQKGGRSRAYIYRDTNRF